MRFAETLLHWVRADQQVRARSFADAGYTACPLGVELWLPTRAVIYLQVVGALSLAQRADSEDLMVTGAPPPLVPPVTLPTEGPTDLAEVERWLAWRITGALSAEIATVRLFQDRTVRGSIPHGLAITFHSGARAWIYFRHATPAGRQPGSGAAWRVQPTV